MTFTLRNDNDYDVGDLEIACTFLRRDGSQLTERSRRLPEVVGMKSRRTFAGISFGVVNINAEQAVADWSPPGAPDGVGRGVKASISLRAKAVVIA